MEARIKNLHGIPDKQTEHGAAQTEAAIRVARAHLLQRCEAYDGHSQEQRRDLLNGLKAMGKLAMDPQLQGTAKAWGLDLLDIFPVDAIPIPEFVEHQWPRLKAKTEAIAASRLAGHPSDSEPLPTKKPKP